MTALIVSSSTITFSDGKETAPFITVLRCQYQQRQFINVSKYDNIIYKHAQLSTEAKLRESEIQP